METLTIFRWLYPCEMNSITHDMTGNEEIAETTELIPVTEERWNELRELKAEDQSYDELVGLLVQEHKRRRLTRSVGTESDGEGESRVWIDE